MKRLTYIAALLLFAAINGHAQIERAAKSVFSLTTFKKDGSILASSHGVFVSNNGEAICTWTPFVGADYAKVIDANGKEMDVVGIIGANEIYDVCKFKTQAKTVAAPIAKQPSKQGDKAWVLLYSVKRPQIEQRNVQSVEQFMNRYTYYIFSTNMPDNSASCPFVNAKGEVIGLVQRSKSGDNVYATDARFIDSLTVKNALAISDPVLRQTGIPVAYPKDHTQASVMLTLAQEQRDSSKYTRYIDNYLAEFPTMTEGYAAKATQQVNANDLDGAEATMLAAISKTKKKDEAHSAFARIIYQEKIYKNDTLHANWTLENALAEARKAHQINPLPAYLHQQAQIIYAQGDYPKALELFLGLTKTPLRNGEIYYEAAQCKSQMNRPLTEITALLDSAIAASPQPLNQIGAPYVLARGTAYFNHGDYRKAVNDFNQYDSLMQGRPLNSGFYYTRQQAEMQIHQYQQALNDINRAIYLTQDSPMLWAEKAQLHYRFNQAQEAVQSAQMAIRLDPNSTDAYILLGLAQIANKQKAEGLKALQKAKELGDTRAEEYLNKYK